MIDVGWDGSRAGPSGIPGFYVSQNPGIFETAIPGFFGIYCHYVLDPLERSYAKNRQNWQKYFSLFIRVNPVPKNPGIPGFGKIPSRKIPGLKILILLGPAYLPTYLTYLPTYLTDLPIYLPDLPDLPDLPTWPTYLPTWLTYLSTNLTYLPPWPIPTWPIYIPDLPTYLTFLPTWPSYLTYLPTWPTYQPDLTRPTYLIFLRTHLPVKNFSTDLK